MMRFITAGIVVCVALSNIPDDSKPGVPPVGPLSPKEELATFRVVKGFRVELVASEPDIIDPVAMAFDEDGRLFVVEMPGYPNNGVATGEASSGKIKMLEPDEKGAYTKCTTFAEGLRFPSSVMPWKGGVIVANAPDMIYLEDTDGDGKADRRRVLYSGFDLSNIEQLLNSLQWGLDNWVYGVAGSAGGDIRCPDKPDMKPVSLRGRGIRFHPETPGSLQPMSGGGQYGLAADDWQQWFTNTNSQHLRHIVLPDHYLQRNPALAVPTVTIDIPDHGAACKVHRISPFEGWRVERTKRRAAGPDAKRFPSTELVPGGYITSACSPVVYTADLFPEAYRGNTFICDPANNLIHRDVLVPNGATFVAQRGDVDCEFLASTDNWFRPDFLTVGPDGALYVADFYREVIETPLSLPDDIKANLNIESRKRGRIWRVVPEGEQARKSTRPQLRKASIDELVRHIADPNAWWRLTAQRLLVERQDKSAVKSLHGMARDSKSPLGRVHALWTLHGLKALEDDEITRALADKSAGIREQGLRLAEDRIAKSDKVLQAALPLKADPAPRVRFQFAFSLGESSSSEATAALAYVAQRNGDNPWIQTAVLSSAYNRAPQMLAALSRDGNPTAGALKLLTRLAAIAGSRGDDAGIVQVLELLTTSTGRPSSVQGAILRGLGQGLQNTQKSLAQLWNQPPEKLKAAIVKTLPFFEQAAATATNEKAVAMERGAAIELLGYGPSKSALPTLGRLLVPQVSSDLQLAAVRALSQHDQPETAKALLSPWASLSPAVRREVIEAIFARSSRIPELLAAVERKQVLAAQIEPARIQQLSKHPDAAVRQHAEKLLAGRAATDRKKVLDDYRAALDFTADKSRGKEVFKKNCATCHRLENVGIEVGPDLVSALRNKSAEQLLTDILDPSREVDPRYINYVVTTKAGRSFSGMIAAETASSVTLRRAEKAEDVILRNQIELLEATAKSLMPEGLEMQMSKQDVADVIVYLQAVATSK
jgi:putative membrane-bound dehydrogenase-like protein